MDRSREQQPYLPTPGALFLYSNDCSQLTELLIAASAELPPQPSPDFVPPMLLHTDANNASSSQASYPNNQQFMPQHMVGVAPHSAPANIVFQTIQSSPYAVPHGDMGDLEEMSPISSPWLGAYNSAQTTSETGGSSRALQQHQPQQGTKRRTVSPGSDDLGPSGRPSRKRQAQSGRLSLSVQNAAANAVAPSIPSMSRTRRGSLRGGTKSASSTPLFPPIGSAGTMTPTSARSSRSHGNVTPNEVPGDTPSPVDLSMPPPAAPQPQAPMSFMQTVTSMQHTPAQTPAPVHSIMPVTPGSFMNLGRLATDSSLTPPIAEVNGQQSSVSKAKGKSTSSRPRSATATAGTGKNASLISPALKPIRPGTFNNTSSYSCSDLLLSSRRCLCRNR
jgi:hypothetical protein